MPQTIGIRRGVAESILTTAASALAATSSVIAIPMDWGPQPGLAFQYSVSGGTFSALQVDVYLSNDGVNFPKSHATSQNPAGDTLVPQDGANAGPIKMPFAQVVISNGVVATGNPVVTVTVLSR